MKILVLNSGSSSLKCQYFIDQQSVASVLIERIGEEESHSEVTSKEQLFTDNNSIANHEQALEKLFSLLKQSNTLNSIETLDAVGHRVVHGGSHFSEPTRITKEVIESIRALIPLAPLHNPANLQAIEIIAETYPKLAQVAVFDTAFHQTMPEYASVYPIPYKFYQDSGIRRYGFHGTSHAYVAKEAAKMLGKDLSTLNLITLHLGNGASATAIKEGKSIDTSMGLTPLEGLMMGTRCGDIDPAIIPFLSQNHKMNIGRIDTLLNKESGLKGICGNNNMRKIIEQSESNDKMSTLALAMYAYRIKKYIGAYTVALGRVDALIFTGGIGEHAVKIREMVCEGLGESIGINIDLLKNAEPSKRQRPIHEAKSKIKIFVIPTNEELEIVLQTESEIF